MFSNIFVNDNKLNTKVKASLESSNAALWRGVIWQALLDLETLYPHNLYGVEAYRWIFSPLYEDDFKNVCDMALMEVKVIKRLARNIIKKRHQVKKIR